MNRKSLAYLYKSTGTCKVGQNPKRDGCVADSGESGAGPSSQGESPSDDNGFEQSLATLDTSEQEAQVQLQQAQEDSASFLEQAEQIGTVEEVMSSPQKQRNMMRAVAGGVIALARLFTVGMVTQIARDFVATVKTVSQLKIVGKGIAAAIGKATWTEEDTKALKRALYDIPAMTITLGVNYALPTGPLFPILYKTPGVKNWFPKELTEPSNDPVTRVLNFVDKYLEMPEKWVSGKKQLEGMSEDQVRFWMGVMELMREDLTQVADGEAEKALRTYTKDMQLMQSPFVGRKSLALMVKETSGSKHEFSSTQFNLDECGYSRNQGSPLAEIERLAKSIPDEDLASDGREDRFHVTVKYGLHTQDPSEVSKLVAGFGPVEMTLGKVSLFPANKGQEQRGGEQYDVVKIDVESEDLHRLNKLISSLPHTDTHPEYKPHITLAYAKPGMGNKHAGNWEGEGFKLDCGDLVFSNKDGNKTKISHFRNSVNLSPFVGRKSLAWLVKGDSYFSECERDDAGHCLPSGQAGQGGYSPSESDKTSETKPESGTSDTPKVWDTPKDVLASFDNSDSHPEGKRANDALRSLASISDNGESMKEAVKDIYEGTLNFWNEAIGKLKEQGVTETYLEEFQDIVGEFEKSIPQKLEKITENAEKSEQLGLDISNHEDLDPSNEEMPGDLIPPEPQEPEEWEEVEGPDDPEYPDEPEEPEAPEDMPTRDQYEGEGADEAFQEDFKRIQGEWKEYKTTHKQWEKDFSKWVKEIDKIDDAHGKEVDKVAKENEKREAKYNKDYAKYEKDSEKWEKNKEKIEEKWREEHDSKIDQWQEKLDSLQEDYDGFMDEQSDLFDEIDNDIGDLNIKFKEYLGGFISETEEREKSP